MSEWNEIVVTKQTEHTGFAIVMHDPGDGGDYVVGPFATREHADEYAAGSLTVFGADGAAVVYELMSPAEVDPKSLPPSHQ